MPAPIIRPYQPGDAADCARLQSRLEQTATITPAAWRQAAHNRLCAHVMLFGGQLVGYAAAAPVPGLTGIGDLFGFIDPAHQKQGLGTQLLEHLCVWLPAAGFTEIAVAVTDLQSPLAMFLLRRQFVLHHEEWLLFCDMTGVRAANSVSNSALSGDNRRQTRENQQFFGDKQGENEVNGGDNFPVYGENSSRDRGKEAENLLKTVTFSRRRAVDTFVELYQASFAQTPWNQPYTAQEANAALRNPNDLIFLLHGETPVGFAWCTPQDGGEMELEPVGIAREWQGRGYGRWLLAHLLRIWRGAGLTAVRLAVWRENEVALLLYQQFGFRRTATSYYLQRRL